MLRRLASVTTLAVTVCAVAALSAPPAYAGPGESDFVSLTNRSRASAGKAGYVVAGDLLALARRHSAEMASKGRIYHNPNLGSDVGNWQAVGENVGMGGSPSSLHNAFMNSSAHRANILDGDFTEVGIGTAVGKDGTLFVTEVFRKPMRSTRKATVAPKRTPRRVASKPSRIRTRPAPTAKAPSRPAPPRKPVASPTAILGAKLAAAAAMAGKTGPVGAVDRAVSYVEVMGTLA